MVGRSKGRQNIRMMTMDSVAGFILIGGAASRMGSDKSQLLIENETFVQRIARELAQVTAQVSVVGRQEQFDPGLPGV